MSEMGLVDLPVLQPAERVKGCCNPLPPALPAERAETLARVHRALADPTRIQMLHLLSRATQPVCVCDFTAAFDLSQGTVSHHLAKLRDAGFITATRRGIWSFYELDRAMPPAARAALGL
ncbi:MAG: helix-turn-helix transcriptional regulator [Candidatus Dormibacteraeota bacterium]|nr:helix-turn-helix transcriptional regulator [Candidatus Dormibacteraeota bacterium]